MDRRLESYERWQFNQLMISRMKSKFMPQLILYLPEVSYFDNTKATERASACWAYYTGRQTLRTIWVTDSSFLFGMRRYLLEKFYGQKT